MHIFFSAGEPSGDQHAAHLLQALRQRVPHARFSGFGGPLLHEAGAELLYPLTDMAVMGVTAVLPLLKKFYDVAQSGRHFIQQQRPDAVVLVDFPGFNWHIAKYAKQAGIPVVYYCPPQLWAWASWRIKKVRKYVDCILSVLPFEAQWYREQGVRVEYVGHPFFDEIEEKRLDKEFCHSLRPRGERLVGLLPGSRRSEVTRNFPTLVAAVRQLHYDHPDVRFPVACYKEQQLEWCREYIDRTGLTLPIDLYVGRTSEIIDAVDCCMMVSGSVSLEVLARGKPATVMYRANLFNYLFGKALIKIKYMCLTNLIVDRELVPEFLYITKVEKTAGQLRDVLHRWLNNPDELTAHAQALDQVRRNVVQTGGIVRAADALLKLLGPTEQDHRRAA